MVDATVGGLIIVLRGSLAEIVGQRLGVTGVTGRLVNEYIRRA